MYTSSLKFHFIIFMQYEILRETLKYSATNWWKNQEFVYYKC